MSWIVETLILNRARIRVNPDFDSVEYNDLLVVESKIQELVNIGAIDHFELAILEFVSSNISYNQLQGLLGIGRSTISNYFKRICKRVSYSLGGYFTDEGYLEYMKREFKLSDTQVNLVGAHMQGRYRHMLRRKLNE